MEYNECIMCQEYKKQIEKLKKEIDILKTRIVKLEGWKGVDDVIIKKIEDDWIVIDHQKDKKSGEVDEAKHVIPHKDVLFLQNIIKEIKADKTNARDVWSILIEKKSIPIDLDAFNGGRNRARYYFPYYYYPVKILEYCNIVEYGGRGTIEKIPDAKLLS